MNPIRSKETEFPADMPEAGRTSNGMKKKLILLALAAIALILAFKYLPRPCGDCSKPGFEQIQVGEAAILVDVADTPEERMQGLSGREELKEGEGMLFVFEEPLTAGFWMKDMRFAIDIIWIGDDLRILGIERAVAPETYPTTFHSPSEVRYVLEVPAGYAHDKSLNVGDVVSIGQ